MPFSPPFIYCGKLIPTMGKWPKLAYYWPSDSMISASAAIEKRNSIIAQGSSGAMLNVTKPIQGMAAICMHGWAWPATFWIGTGNFNKVIGCDYDVSKSRHSESHRYSQVFHDLFNWLEASIGNEELNLSSVRKSRLSTADIVLEHSPIGEMVRTSTYVLVRDKNRKRTPSNPHTIIVDISRWPESHVTDFESHEIYHSLRNGKDSIKKRSPQFLRKENGGCSRIQAIFKPNSKTRQKSRVFVSKRKKATQSH